MLWLASRHLMRISREGVRCDGGASSALAQHSGACCGFQVPPRAVHASGLSPAQALAGGEGLGGGGGGAASMGSQLKRT